MGIWELSVVFLQLFSKSFQNKKFLKKETQPSIFKKFETAYKRNEMKKANYYTEIPFHKL